MKVLHVVGSLDENMGGPSRSVPQTCEFVSKLGVDIKLVTRSSKNQVKVNTSQSFIVKNCSFLGLIKFGFSLSKKNTDIIHLQHVWDPYIHVMAWFAWLKGIPYIITPRGMLEPWIMNHNPWKKKLGMFFYQKKDIQKSACIHATCELEKNNIRKLGFKNHIVIIPNGVDLSLIPESKKNYKTKKIVFLSRIHLKKGIELLLESWKQIASEDWVLEIAGDGDTEYIDSLKKKIINEKIKRVKFVGPQYEDNKWTFIKSGSIFVLPTYSENFGIVVAEALAVGVPVITTQGTPWEELNTNNCGWWIDLTIPNLKNALIDSMHKSEESLFEMGVNGKKLINEHYDIKVVAGKVREIYLKINENEQA